MWGSCGASCEVAYSATKGGVNAFTKALAKELAPSHISVNAIAFGVIDTEMNGHLDEEERRSLEEEIPFGRFADAKEAGSFICHVEEADLYLTGQIIGFDGGFL
jgi:3-oxoacyl-[acyl-carrier protein] reductase